MGTGRNTLTTPTTNWQHVFSPLTTTTNATPTALYTSPFAVTEGMVVAVRAYTIIQLADFTKAGSFYTEAIIARATGGNIRLADANFQRVAGEIQSNAASLAWTVDTATQKFALTATGKAATTYQWIPEVYILRNV